MKTQLFDFWPDGSIGHVDVNGIDIGKEFLSNLGNDLENVDIKTVSIYSHFIKNSFMRNLSNRIGRILTRKFSDNLSRRKIIHGHPIVKMKLNPNNFNMWYTPENMRPPLDQDYDVFLSHDTDDYDGRNLYLPIWATRLAGTLDASILRQQDFTKPRNTNVLNQKGICAVISNPEPVRMAFIKELRKYVPVDIYGALGKPIEDKNEILSQYKFNICFENDHFPGYVTEKPIEAWENGCIPIWWGNDIKNYLNPEAIIDVSKLGFMAAIEEISASLISDDKYQSIFRQPLLNKEFNFEKLNETIQNIAKTRRESYKQNSRF